MDAADPTSATATKAATISQAINTATRKQHAELNRKITERLSLALPPQASDPSLLGQGLAAFAQIFFDFERAWSAIELQAVDTRVKEGDEQPSRLAQWLTSLRPPGLERSPRLRQDLQHISSITGKPLPTPCGSLALRNRLEKHPHLLVAYAWVMYMAIFSGGRWIRSQFHAAGPEFWTSKRGVSLTPAKDLNAPDPWSGSLGFSFLLFDGEGDGMDIAEQFRERLALAEEFLTGIERDEIIDEAVGIFERCLGSVDELDLLSSPQERGMLASRTPAIWWFILSLVSLAAAIWGLTSDVFGRGFGRRYGGGLESLNMNISTLYCAIRDFGNVYRGLDADV